MQTTLQEACLIHVWTLLRWWTCFVDRHCLCRRGL